jgi:hypothetical protein
MMQQQRQQTRIGNKLKFLVLFRQQKRNRRSICLHGKQVDEIPLHVPQLGTFLVT